eukprot:5024320-Amphidinium_carterae.1
MPCFLHAAYTPPALDFLGAGCAVSVMALRLSGGALDARVCMCVSGPADPDGGIGTASVTACADFGCAWTSCIKSMGGSASALACLLGCWPLGCFGTSLTLVAGACAAGFAAICTLSSVAGCVAGAAFVAQGCGPAALDVVWIGNCCPVDIASAKGYGLLEGAVSSSSSSSS